MSRLIDNLKKVSGITPQPIGFGRLREEAVKARILLIARVKQDKPQKGAEALEKVDAVVYPSGSPETGAGTGKGKSFEAPSVPFGWWRDAADKEAADAGDFVVFTATAPVTAYNDSKLGKILAIDTGMEAVLVRAINDLPVDAVLVSGEQDESAPLTYESLMHFRLCASLLEKPLLAAVPVEITSDEMIALWNAGINGVLVTVEGKNEMDKLAELSASIRETTFPSRRKDKKMEPSLPAVAVTAEKHREEEEEEEDE